MRDAASSGGDASYVAKVIGMQRLKMGGFAIAGQGVSNTFLIVLSIMEIFGLALYAFAAPATGNGEQLIILVASIAIIAFALHRLLDGDFNVLWVFFSTYYASLAVSCLQLSQLQHEKSFYGAYYYFLGPLIFGAILSAIDAASERFPRLGARFKLDGNKLALCLILLYVMIRCYVGWQMGFRLFHRPNGLLLPGDAFDVPGVSGLGSALQWSILMILPFARPRTVVMGIAAVFLFSIVLHVKRGDLVRVGLFLALVFMRRARIELRPAFLAKLIAVAFISLSVFSLFGRARENMRGGEFSLQTFVQSRFDSDPVNWALAYSALNFDVLTLHIENEHLGKPYYLTIPIRRLLGDRSYVPYFDDLGAVRLGGLNGGTFLSVFVRDLGPLYVIELGLFSILVCSLFVFSKRNQLYGVQCFIGMIICLFGFGNYMFEPSMFYAVVMVLFLHLLFAFEPQGDVKIDNWQFGFSWPRSLRSCMPRLTKDGAIWSIKRATRWGDVRRRLRWNMSSRR